jgi:LysM repeat protein
VWAIVQANNIANPNVIHPGQCLQIPKGGPPPSGVIKPGCEHLQWPTEGVSLAGVVQAKGTAKIDNFWYYKLEYRHDGLDGWHYVTGAETPVEGGILGEWNTTQVSDGRYFFRLVVVDRTGNYPPPCEVVVNVNNDP